MESWTEKLEDKVIKLWQQNECLYDIRCKAFSDRIKKRSAVEKIAKETTKKWYRPETDCEKHVSSGIDHQT